MELVFNSSFHYPVGDVAKIIAPNISDEVKNTADYLGREAGTLSKNDYNSFETSWEFEMHPLI